MKTEETNKLIAEFMGLQLEQDQERLFISGLGTKLINETFNKDWNWLMGVVEKIYQTDLYYDKYIDFNSSMIDSGKIKLSTNIQNVYNQVVEFIKWYNEQQISAKNN